MTDRTPPPDPSIAQSAVFAALLAVAGRLEAATRLTPVAGRPVLQAIADAAVAVLAAEAASIAVHDPTSDRLVFVVAAGPHGDGVVGLAIDASSGIAGYALTTGQALAVADVDADARFDRDAAARTGYLPRSILAVPLNDDEGTLGVMEVLDRRTGRGFDLRDLDVATALARPASAALRAGDPGRDASALLRGALAALLGDTVPGGDIDALVTAVAEGLDDEADGARWRLADRLARLREADPETMDLAVAWLDALLRHERDRRR
jgi:putative methionine-R-sulfoxide reductase with GAF domain